MGGNQKNGEFIYPDPVNPSQIGQVEMKSWAFSTGSHGPAIAKLGENLVIAQVHNSNDADTDKGIYLWDYGLVGPVKVGELADKRQSALPAVLSGRFFKPCYTTSMYLELQNQFSYVVKSF